MKASNSRCIAESHETRATVFRYREYDIKGNICTRCGLRFFEKADLDKIPIDEFTMDFPNQVKEI